MIPSNILGVFSPPEDSNSLKDEELCLPCQLMGAATCIIGGLYFMSELPFKEDPKVKQKKPTPLYWKPAVKTSGGVLIGFGIYRAFEGFLWNKDLKYKKPYF